ALSGAAHPSHRPVEEGDARGNGAGQLQEEAGGAGLISDAPAPAAAARTPPPRARQSGSTAGDAAAIAGAPRPELYAISGAPWHSSPQSLPNARNAVLLRARSTVAQKCWRRIAPDRTI